MPHINLTEEERGALVSALEEAMDNDAPPELTRVYHRVLDAGDGDDDRVQFAHLLSEVLMSQRNFERLKEVTGLDGQAINDVLDRARRVWEEAKPPADFGEEMTAYFKEGLSTDEILEKIDPDTAGEDMVCLLRRLILCSRDKCFRCGKTTGNGSRIQDHRVWCSACWSKHGTSS